MLYRKGTFKEHFEVFNWMLPHGDVNLRHLWRDRFHLSIASCLFLIVSGIQGFLEYFRNPWWHPLMAFIVSYTFACYSRSNSIIYEHTADIFFLSMSFNCSDIDHLIKLRTQTCTAFLYFQHLLSPSSSGSCVIHSRSSRYLLLIHLEIITPPLHTSFFCRNWHGVVASFLAKFSDVILS